MGYANLAMAQLGGIDNPARPRRETPCRSRALSQPHRGASRAQHVSRETSPRHRQAVTRLASREIHPQPALHGNEGGLAGGRGCESMVSGPSRAEDGACGWIRELPAGADLGKRHRRPPGKRDIHPQPLPRAAKAPKKAIWWPHPPATRTSWKRGRACGWTELRKHSFRPFAGRRRGLRVDGTACACVVEAFFLARADQAASDQTVAGLVSGFGEREGEDAMSREMSPRLDIPNLTF